MKRIVKFIKRLIIKSQLRDLEIQMMFFEIGFSYYEKEKEQLYSQLESEQEY